MPDVTDAFSSGAESLSHTTVALDHERGETDDMTSLGYLAAVNVVIWIGLFAYLWRLDRRVSEKERS